MAEGDIKGHFLSYFVRRRANTVKSYVGNLFHLFNSYG